MRIPSSGRVATTSVLRGAIAQAKHLAARLLQLGALILSLTPLAAWADAPFDPFSEVSIESEPGAVVPLDLPVQDEGGRIVTLRELGGGKPIVLVPMLHNCPNICPVLLRGVADAIAAQPYQPGSDFVLVAFGIDPEETAADAAETKASLLKEGHASLGKGFHAVTADAKVVEAVTDALGYRYAFDDRIDQYAHAAATAVLTAEGRLARWLYGIAPQATDLRLALTEAGEGRIGGITDQFLLLCYQYDPQTGRYNSIVWLLLRGTGIVTVLLLGGFIGRSLLRERRRARRAR